MRYAKNYQTFIKTRKGFWGTRTLISKNRGVVKVNV